jgi:hypothetical protein
LLKVRLLELRPRRKPESEPPTVGAVHISTRPQLLILD